MAYTDKEGSSSTTSTTRKLVNVLDLVVNKCSSGSVISTAEGGGSCGTLDATFSSSLSGSTIVNLSLKSLWKNLQTIPFSRSS